MSDDITKVTTPRGEARAVREIPPHEINPSFGGQSTGDWFGPSVPMAPVAPDSVRGREWDYPAGLNLSQRARGYEPVSFETLRALADNCDLLRLVIERRKDQMCRASWSIRPRTETGTKPRKGELPPEMRERIDEVTRLFRRPSYNKTFRGFLRELLEDLFVLDAPTIFLKRDQTGRISGLSNMSGAVVRVVIDEWGRTPEPMAWSGEPFQWNGVTVTRENYLQFGRVLGGFFWPVTHQQVLKGLSAVNLTSLDVVYRPYNLRLGHGGYGFSQTEQVLNTVSIAIRRSASQLAYFTEGNTPAAIFSLPETWSPDQVGRFQSFWDNLFIGDLGRRRQMRFVAGGGKLQPLHEPPLKSETDEWLARVIAFAFSYPPSALVKLSNRSVAEQHERTAEEEGLGPLQQWAKEVFDDIIEIHLGHDDLEFSWAEEAEVDQKVQSEILTRYAEAGALTLNQLRERIGEEPDPDPAANRLMVRTPNGYRPIGDDDRQPVAGDDDVDDDATKLAKGMIIMVAPADWKPLARFTLGTTTYLPNIAKRQLRAFGEDHIAELEAAGWRRLTPKK